MAVDVAMLQTIPLFGNLTETQLEKIANLCSEKSISCGETFFKEGEPGKTFFVVPRGEVEVLLTVGKDALACLKWVGVGEILGIQALAPPYRYSSTGRSVTEGTLLAIDAGKLDQLFQQDSQLAFSFLTSLMGAALNRIDGLRSMIQDMSKYSLDILNQYVFPYAWARDPDILLGSAFSEDVALTRVGEDILVSHVDPIVGAIEQIGWLAVHFTCNDIATSGARPCWLLVLVPRMEEVELLEQIMQDGNRATQENEFACMQTCYPRVS